MLFIATRAFNGDGSVMPMYNVPSLPTTGEGAFHHQYEPTYCFHRKLPVVGPAYGERPVRCAFSPASPHCGCGDEVAVLGGVDDGDCEVDGVAHADTPPNASLTGVPSEQRQVHTGNEDPGGSPHSIAPQS